MFTRKNVQGTHVIVEDLGLSEVKIHAWRGVVVSL